MLLDLAEEQKLGGEKVKNLKETMNLEIEKERNLRRTEKLALQTETAGLKKSIHSRCIDIIDLEKENQAKNQEIITLRRARQEAKDKAARSEGWVKRIETEKQNLQQQVTDLKGTIKSQVQEVTGYKEYITKLVNENQNLTKRVSTLEKNLTRAIEALRPLEDERSDLLARTEKAEAKLNAEKRVLQEENNNLRDGKIRLEAQVATLEEMVKREPSLKTFHHLKQSALQAKRSMEVEQARAATLSYDKDRLEYELDRAMKQNAEKGSQEVP